MMIRRSLMGRCIAAQCLRFCPSSSSSRVLMTSGMLMGRRALATEPITSNIDKGKMADKAKEAAHKVQDKVHHAEEVVSKKTSPEVKKYPSEFTLALSAGALGVAMMLWWFYISALPQKDIRREAARRGGMGPEEAKQMVQAAASAGKPSEAASNHPASLKK